MHNPWVNIFASTYRRQAVVGGCMLGGTGSTLTTRHLQDEVCPASIPPCSLLHTTYYAYFQEISSPYARRMIPKSAPPHCPTIHVLTCCGGWGVLRGHNFTSHWPLGFTRNFSRLLANAFASRGCSETRDVPQNGHRMQTARITFRPPDLAWSLFGLCFVIFAIFDRVLASRKCPVG